MKSPYEILGVVPGATEKEIKEAYKRLAKKWHPDANFGNKESEKMMQEINSAYEQAMKWSGTGGSLDFSFDDVFKDFAYKFRSSFGRADSFSEDFETWKTGGMMSIKVECDTVCDIDKMLNGLERAAKVKTPTRKACPKCGGVISEMLSCKECGGTGREMFEREEVIKICLREEKLHQHCVQHGNFVIIKALVPGTKRLLDFTASLPEWITIKNGDILHSVECDLLDVIGESELVFATVCGKKFKVKKVSTKYLNDINIRIPKLGVYSKTFGTVGDYVFQIKIPFVRASDLASRLPKPPEG